MERRVSSYRPPIRWLLGIAIVGSLFSTSARADVFKITLVPTPISISAGASGSFEVLLTDEAGGTGATIAGFDFTLQSTSTDLTFTGATDNTTTTYIFSGGYSLFSPDLAIGTSPELIASDVYAIPGSGAAMSGGQTFALGEVYFNVSPTAATESIGVNFDASFTDLSDASGNAVPIASMTGALVNVTGAVTPMPEPSFYLMFIGGTLLFLPIIRMGRVIGKRG
jgi:hypothetical protein